MAGTGKKVNTTAGIPNSVLYQTFLAAGAQVLGMMLEPGPKRATKQDFNVNPGEATDLWPYICGTVETTPHLINYFDFASKKVKNDVGVGDMLAAAAISALGAGLAVDAAIPNLPSGAYPPGKGPKIAEASLVAGLLSAFSVGLGQLRTYSYRYYCGFLYGICHGPIDSLTGAKVDQRIVSNGAAAGAAFLIDDPQAWGGDHVDGGFYAVCDLVKGDFWPLQQPNPYLVQVLGSDVPAYSGKALFIIRGPSGYRESGYFAASAGGAPALRPLILRVRRLPSNLGVPAYKNISNGDANPAECIYEWLTSPAFGVKKLSSSKIDLASFQAGALLHFNEGLGVSLEFNSNTNVESALDTFTSLTDAILWGRFRSGTIYYKPIRRTYTIGALPVFRRGPDGSNPALYNVIREEGFTPGTWASTANDLRFDFIDRDNNFLRTPRQVQDSANHMLTGQVRSLSQRMEGISNANTAALVGTRELRAASYPRPPITLIVNRDAYSLEPGDVIKYINNVDNFTKILRIAEVEDGDGIESSEIKLICVEDQYGVGGAAYIAPPPSTWSDPLGVPVVAALAKSLEAPYFLTKDDDARLFVFAGKPNNAQLDFDVYVSTDGGTNYIQEGSRVGFAVGGTIVQSINRLTAGVLTSLTFTADNAFDASRLASATALEVAGGANIIYFDDGTGEFMAVESVTDNLNGTFTLGNIWRAVHPFDSVPAPHAVAARVWFFTYGDLVTATEYALGVATKTKVLPRTMSATLALASATAINVTIGTRALKPNPVRNVLINTGYLTSLIGATADVQVDWSETNRLLEGSVVKQTDAGVVPELTTTYTVRWYATEAGGNVLLRTESGIVASTGAQTATMTTAEEMASGGYLGNLSASYRVEIDVLRGGNVSTTYIRELNRPAPVPVISMGITVIPPTLTTVLTMPTISMGIVVIAPTAVLTPQTNVLAAQVLDWSPEESASDVGVTPDPLKVQVFS